MFFPQRLALLSLHISPKMQSCPDFNPFLCHSFPSFVLPFVSNLITLLAWLFIGDGENWQICTKWILIWEMYSKQCRYAYVIHDVNIYSSVPGCEWISIHENTVFTTQIENLSKDLEEAKTKVITVTVPVPTPGLPPSPSPAPPLHVQTRQRAGCECVCVCMRRMDGDAVCWSWELQGDWGNGEGYRALTAVTMQCPLPEHLLLFTSLHLSLSSLSLSFFLFLFVDRGGPPALPAAPLSQLQQHHQVRARIA